MMDEVKVKMEMPISLTKDRHASYTSNTDIHDIETERKHGSYVGEELDGEDKGQETFQGRQLDSNQKCEVQPVTSPSFLYECKVCLRIFNSSSSLMAHMLSHKLSLTNIKLSHNNANRVNRRKSVDNLQKREVNFKNNQIMGNAKSLLSNSVYKNQFLSNRVKCSFCSKDFQNRKRLTTHILRFHNDPAGDIDSDSTCKNFPGRLPKSKKADKIVCHICGSVFESKKFLGVHVMSVHREPQVFKSNECSQLFEKIESVFQYKKLQKKNVDGDKPEGCKKLKRSDGENLTNFQNSKNQFSMENKDLELFQCVHCQMPFEDGEAFQNHLNSLSGKCELVENPKLQVCPICGKVLKTSLVDHMRIHSGERPHQCSSCPARFKRNHQLKMHNQSVHSDVAMFKCEICSKSFKRKDKLHCHYRTHSDEHPYMCVECGNVFKWKHHLKRHRDNVHGGKMVDENSKQFCCDFCGGMFKWKHHMKRHMRNVHHIHDNKTMSSYARSEVNAIPQKETNLQQHSLSETNISDEKTEDICISTVKKVTSDILNCQETGFSHFDLPNDKQNTNINGHYEEKVLDGNIETKITHRPNFYTSRDNIF